MLIIVFKVACSEDCKHSRPPGCLPVPTLWPAWFVQGVVQQERVVLASDLDGFTVTPHSSTTPGCPRCTFNSTAYMAGVGVTMPPDAPPLNLTCINDISCSWGVGWCQACLQGLQQGDVRTQHDWFDAAFVDGGANSTNAQRFEACVTFCHTYRQLMWFGADFEGSMLRSQDVERYLLKHDPLAVIAAFPNIFGLSSYVAEYLDARAVQDGPDLF